MNLDQYRIHKKLEVDPPIICIAEIINPSVARNACKTITVSMELTKTSGLAHDNTIIFSGIATIGKEKVFKYVNEKNICS